MRARFGDDSSIFLVDWQWAPDGARPLPFPTAFASDHNDPEHTDGGQVGEVRKIFYPLAKTFLPGFLKGDHQCGSEDFWQNGWPEGTPGIPIVNLVPTCCIKLYQSEDCTCTTVDATSGFYVTTACTCTEVDTTSDYYVTTACTCTSVEVPVPPPTACTCTSVDTTSRYYVTTACYCTSVDTTSGYYVTTACTCTEVTAPVPPPPGSSCTCTTVDATSGFYDTTACSCTEVDATSGFYSTTPCTCTEVTT